jgi:hypothetical protein
VESSFIFQLTQYIAMGYNASMTEKNKGNPEHKNPRFAPKETFETSSEAARELLTNCTGLFFEAADRQFGIPDHKGIFYHASAPWHNFSRVEALLLPKPLKALATNPNEFSSVFGTQDNAYVVHYPITRKTFVKTIEKSAEVDRWANELKGDVSQMFDARQFVTNFYDTHNDPSCIYTNLYDDLILIGDKHTMQRTANFLKSAPENTLDLLKDIGIPSEYIRVEKRGVEPRNASNIHLYDLVGKPKELHYKLPHPA